MHRARLFTLLLGVATVLVMTPLVATATVSDAWVLAQSETEPAEEVPLGPEPVLDNTFQPDDYERSWTWGLGWVLAVVGALAVGGTAAGYYLLVWRPEQDSEGR